jgi:predicted transcriptional regulator of viral defense system
MKTLREKTMTVARNQSVFRAADVSKTADPRSTLRRMTNNGELIRVGRGLYMLPEVDITENHSSVEAMKRYPGGVLCLISALRFHDIGTQIPYEIWLMRQDRKAAPHDHLPVHFIYSSGAAFKYGVEMHSIEGTEFPVYSPAKTVADCFKYRNKIGLDVALEALKEGWRARQFTMNELHEAATICRVTKIIQPYAEILVA